MVYLLTIMVVLSIVLSLIRIHYITNNVKDVSMVWGVVTFIMYIIKGGWMISLLGSFLSFLVAWLLFSLSNYLEERFFLRIVVLVFSMGAMLIVLSYFLN